jgi:hypothetical protein
MRFVSRVFITFASALFLLGAFGVFQPAAVWAQDVTTNTDPTAGLDAIVGTNAQGAGAVGLIFANICDNPEPAAGTDDTCKCRDKGQCELDDVLQVFVNITILILGISGSVILLMFVYGGLLWITSRGDAKRIEKGKDTITHAVIGFAIILLSYSLINFLVASFAGDAASSTITETIDNADDGNPDLNSTTP